MESNPTLGFWQQLRQRGRRRSGYRCRYAPPTAIRLIGETKKGDDRWYEVNVPLAEKLYATHLEQLMEEGSIDGKEVS